VQLDDLSTLVVCVL